VDASGRGRVMTRRGSFEGLLRLRPKPTVTSISRTRVRSANGTHPAACDTKSDSLCGRDLGHHLIHRMHDSQACLDSRHTLVILPCCLSLSDPLGATWSVGVTRMEPPNNPLVSDTVPLCETRVAVTGHATLRKSLLHTFYDMLGCST
jgi:hypothetical protein